MNLTPKKALAGFTLVEMVVGIVVMAIALTMLTSVFFSSPSRSVEPILQIRAAAFGQALMDEILGKAFDETSPVGGVPACTICTPSAAFGLDTDESRNNFDDVDDYNTYCDSASHLIDAQGNTLDIMYTAYTMKVCVVYDGNFDGIEDTNTNAKLITLQIFLPPGAGLDSGITFQAYRGNF